VTGRSLHDALLRVLTSAGLRQRVISGDAGGLGTAVGAGEAAVLCRADPERLTRLARFLGRHFYRERIVRLFAASRRLAREAGCDPLTLLETPTFDTVLDVAEVGSLATAERVVALVEVRLLGALGARDYGPALVAYEGTLFRVEAGPRRWTGRDGSGAIPARAASTRVVGLDWDVTALIAAARRGDAALPEPLETPTRLLVALSPDGRVTAVRCSAALGRLLDALDGVRSVEAVARAAGLTEPDVVQALRQLTDAGAVEWLECRGR